jgi:hypothetical protein
MIIEVDLIPVPADTSLYDEEAQYIAVDSDGNYHTAKWDGEQLLLDGATSDEVGEDEGGEDVDIVLIGVAPDLDLPTTI